MDITEKLFALRDEEYARFQSRLTPTLAESRFIGVRVPALRKLAREYGRDPDSSRFLDALPHTYYDENLLHALLLADIRDYGTVVERVDAFLPYVDNWAVCDTLPPKAFRRHQAELIGKIREWAASGKVYTCRFGVDMLMTHFLDENFRPEYLEIPASVRSEEYYVNMMIAWFFATALAKQWEAAVPYLEKKRLGEWVRRKTIQKARESFRIAPEQKEYLKSLR